MLIYVLDEFCKDFSFLLKIVNLINSFVVFLSWPCILPALILVKFRLFFISAKQNFVHGTGSFELGESDISSLRSLFHANDVSIAGAPNDLEIT